jgi:hypothetical protein
MTQQTNAGTGLLDEFGRLATEYRVPIEDVLLIALNLHGVDSIEADHRARLTLSLTRAPDERFLVVVPMNRADSPFRRRGDTLTVDGVPVAQLHRVDADAAIGGYFRSGGDVVTLNPNARSRCTGCAFCPTTLEVSADPRLNAEAQLAELLHALAAQSPRGHLRTVREVTVSTGCFEREETALDHLLGLRRVLTAGGLRPRIGFLSSVLRGDDAFAVLAADVAPFLLYVTVECFTRRELMLKSSKADLAAAEIPGLLRRARRAGLDTSFNYVVGLDPLTAVVEHVRGLAPHVSVFPNVQVFQAHTRFMESLRTADGADLVFYLRARRELERIFAPLGLRPESWRNYRPLWYFEYAGTPLTGPRI